LRPGIARGRLCTSVLVVPQKMSLVEAFHGAAMAVVRAPWPAMGSSPERGRSGNGGEGQRARLTVLEVGTPRGVAALGRAAGRLLLASVLFVQTVA
jgi:hypothetical protein